MKLQDSIQEIPIGEFWKESYIALKEIEVPVGNFIAEDPYRDIANFFIIIGLVIFLIFAHRRIIIGISSVLAALTSSKRLVAIEKQSNLLVCRNTLFMFLTVCSSFVFANIAYATKIVGYTYSVPVKFAGILAAILLYFLFRRIALRFLAWLNRNPVLNLTDKLAHTYSCLWYMAVLCSFIVIKSIPSAPMGYMRYCMIFSTLLVFIPYFLALYKIFLQKGISHFFYILYLCTLEILPIALLLHLNFS